MKAIYMIMMIMVFMIFYFVIHFPYSYGPRAMAIAGSEDELLEYVPPGKLRDDVSMRLSELESKLRRVISRLDGFQAKLDRLIGRIERLQRLEHKVSRIDTLESKIERVDDMVRKLDTRQF